MKQINETDVMLTIDDDEYPRLLRNIEDPPRQLYCRGDISLLGGICIGIVGTRKYSEYGRWAALTAGSRLAGEGICIASGMARGVDTCAHKGALKVKGKTIAVLGTGLDVTYPAANRQLKEQIAREGLLITEYPATYPPAKYTFPRRNRIISGISRAVIIAEAGLFSGSLITAERAAEQGREVYVIPANINNPNAAGSNMLLREGAVPLVRIDDIFDDMGIERKPQEENAVLLGDDESRLFDLLKESGEMSVNDICRKLSVPPSKANGIITVLEMKGVVHTASGKIFLAK